MRIAILANAAPFIRGGAEAHVDGLSQALRAAGHEVAVLTAPFAFEPAAAVDRAMAFWDGQDFCCPNGRVVDRLISLQFPTWGAWHTDHVTWIMHQHRAVYDLFEPTTADSDAVALRERVTAFDNRHLGDGRRLFANSANVAARLERYNGLQATPLHHPPPGAEFFFGAESLGYVFCPSRLEGLKRQALLIRGAAQMARPVPIFISGAGGQRAGLEKLIEAHGLGDRVRLLGEVSEAYKRVLYAHALAVFFGPVDEDYGYVTLEAMLARRPVITCTDSGGPLAFVEDGVTGRVVAPEPAALADALDTLAAAPGHARALGEHGFEAYSARAITWSGVVDALTG